MENIKMAREETRVREGRSGSRVSPWDCDIFGGVDVMEPQSPPMLVEEVEDRGVRSVVLF